jgi:hypothetical protein
MRNVPSLSVAFQIGFLAILGLVLMGCQSGYDYRSMNIEFLDEAPSNTTNDEEFGELDC